MVETLLANPALAVVMVIVAIIVAKVLKVAGKVLKAIVCLGIAYVIINVIMSGVI